MITNTPMIGEKVNTEQKAGEVTVRLILPSRVEEITGTPEDVHEKMTSLIELESDIGQSYAEIIPFPTPKRTHPVYGKVVHEISKREVD